jgi:hypothetical protein
MPNAAGNRPWPQQEQRDDACKACPFRVGARVVYDADALEALHDGCEPSCHQRVGMENIFHEYAPTANRCHGYDAWMRDEPGFATPNVAGNRTVAACRNGSG